MDFVDTHCHIQSAGLAKGEQTTRQLWAKADATSVDDIVARARAAGVRQMICVGCDLPDSQLAVDCVQSRPDLYASVGIHPHEAQKYAGQQGLLSAFAKLLNESPQLSRLSGVQGDDEQRTEPYMKYGEGAAESLTQQSAKSAGKQSGTARKIVAVGETGLDYFYNNSPKPAQIELLKFQIELALAHGLPLIFHVREAFDDFWPIFESYPAGTIRGVLHSFTDSAANLQRALGHSLFIGVNGIATFARVEQQNVMYRTVPLDSLLLETDAPFLTPAPYRGTVNEPKHIRTIAEFLSKFRGESPEDLAGATTKNARKLFGF